ncbi:MAG: pilin [Acidiferrobacterales bacterium]
MKQQVQTGFTLLELLIVVTIIGILAAIAVPAYQDYTLRTRISEAASLSAPAKTAVDLAYSDGHTIGNMPSQTTLGLSSPGSYRSKYVLSVATDANGVITITLTNNTQLGSAASGTLTYTPTSQGGNLRWAATCSFSARFCPKI